MNYDVTIGIPVYRSEAYIRRALESALSQSYSSIEFLVVDDGSDDDSLNQIRYVVDRSVRTDQVRVVLHDKNSGVSASRNRIIDEARGEYIFFMDSDDEIADYTISLLMDNARRYDAEIVFGSYEKIEMNGSRNVYQYPSLQFLKEDQLAVYAYSKYGAIQASACNYLVKTSLLRHNNLRFIDVNFWEDFVFTFELVTYISRAVLLPNITYSYYCREGSLSHYQKRGYISKNEVLNNVHAIDYLKSNTHRFKGKEYFSNRCLYIVLTDYYIANFIIEQRNRIVPSVSNREIKSYMRHPASFFQILHFDQSRFNNLLFFLLGNLPSYLCVCTLRLLGKIKQII